MMEAMPEWAEPDAERPNLWPWVRLPSAWIEDRGLTKLSWARGSGADNIAALMALTVIAHCADQQTGAVRLTWDDLCACTDLSRAKLAKGLDILSNLKLIERGANGRSRFQLTNFDPKRGWAMFPARGLYNRQGVVQAFTDFKLRTRAELDALKIYFLLAARRDRNTNCTLLSYERISDYSGIHHNYIRTALSLLASQNLVHMGSRPSGVNEYGIVNSYRLAHLDTRRHAGTIGRESV